MTTQTTAARSDMFTVGWTVLLIISACGTLNHIMLPIYDKNNLAVAIFAVGFSVYSLVVFAIPYRRGERWAWYAAWMPIFAFGSFIFWVNAAAGEMQAVMWTYFIAAIAMAISQAVAYPTFFPRSKSESAS